MGLRSDLCIVHLYVETKWYEIKCGKPKVEQKHEINTRTACNSKEAYESNPGAVEYSLEIPEVAHHQAWLFKRIMQRQRSGKMKHSPVFVMYSYDDQGKLHKDYHLRGVWFESMSQEGNETFDMKGGALNSVNVV